MNRKALLCFLLTALTSTAFAAEGPVPNGVRHLDHVFVIVMENHGYSQLVGNPAAPFINEYMKQTNLATNYFADGHPSLTNYLEIVGGSNFGVRSDNDPDWHNTNCTPNLASGLVSTDNPSSPTVCPIAGTGTDAETPAIDLTNECPSVSPCPCGAISRQVRHRRLRPVGAPVGSACTAQQSRGGNRQQIGSYGLGRLVEWPRLSTSVPAAGCGLILAVEKTLPWKAQNAFHFSTATTAKL
jgi:hypothetical protein